MTVAPDAGQDGRPGPVERPPGASSPSRPDSAKDRAERRREIRRRAQQRARLRQAVAVQLGAGRPGGSTGRLVVGLAVLAVVVAVTGAGGLLTGPADPAPVTPVAATVAPPPARPTPAPEPPPGPELSAAFLEANGSVAGCTFHPRLGELREKLGAFLVGDCVEDPLVAAGADALQRTTRGQLVWSKTDARASFTDGHQTWIEGPNGIVRRGNHERFAWERGAETAPRPSPTASFVLPPALPGAILPGRRIVSYYGNPLTAQMGVLGELPPEALFPRLRAQAEAYAKADRSRPTVPALELVAVVAQADPGPDGLYRLRMDTELIERVSGWAEQNGFLLILDIQVGRGTVDDEVRWLLPFLKRPHVHLALDPEFAMPPGQVPGARIGTMDAATINGALRTLADLVEAEGLPPKLLIVHRFTEQMVTNARKIVTDPRVQVVMVMDGFGGPGIKTRQYADLIAAERVQYTGFKLFYRHDEPLMTPTQVLLLEPAPDLIIYQ